MQITEFHAKNILGLPKNELGVHEVQVFVGTDIEITGANGVGKSSILEALRAALGGGSLEKLKSIDADGKPEAAVVFDEGAFRLERTGDKLVLRERVKNDKKGDAYKTKEAPQGHLDAWFDVEGSNPIRFLRAAQKDRLNLFLKAMPLTLTDEQVRAALGADVFTYPSVVKVASAGGHPLVLLAGLHDAIYAERRGINVAEREKRDTVRQLTQDISEQEPVSQDGISALELERDDRTNRIAQARADAETAHLRATSDAVNARKTFEAARRQQLDADMAKLRAAAEADMSAARDVEMASRTTADEARADSLAALTSDQSALDAVTIRLAEARAQLERAAKDQRTRDLATKYEQEANGLLGKSEQLTAGLDAIVKLKAELLSALPIPGIEVTDKDIFVNGIPFEQLNESQQLELAIDVIILRSAKFPVKVAFIDGAEVFDEKHRERIKEKLLLAGVQAVICRVTEGPLEIA